MYKLILVDDERATLSTVSKFIQAYFPDIHLCGCFYDGEEALSYLLANPVDIVVTDIRMPIMDGLELAKEIHSRSLPCITIIISGYSEFSYAKSALSYNVFNYLLKPLNFRELRACLTNALSLCRRNAPKTGLDLKAESLEILFTDLLLGMFPTRETLSQSFSEFGLNFSDYDRPGILLRITLDNYRDFVSGYDTDALASSLRNIIQLTLQDSQAYFVRRASCNFYYIVSAGEPIPMEQALASICGAAWDLLHFRIRISGIQSFLGLSELIPAAPDHQAAPAPALDNQAIAHAIEYMTAHYGEALSRESVAETVFLSPSHFSYLFKKTTGITFMNYLTNIRMKKALELLNTGMRINEIAEKTGYTGTNRFFVNFRQYTGYNPTEYRKKILYMETEDETKK